MAYPRWTIVVDKAAMNEADAARFLGISVRKMASLRVAGIARKNAIGSYSVEDLIALTQPTRLQSGWVNPVDDSPTTVQVAPTPVSAAVAKARRRKLY